MRSPSEAFEAGDGDGDYDVGALLEERGDLAGAEVAYRRGAERGDAMAANSLGFLLHQRGDLAGAEAAYRRGDQSGDGMAAYGLGAILHRRGREAEAQAAYRRAIDAGYNDGWLGVGLLLAKQRGQEAEAEAAYRKAIDGGATRNELELAAFKLGDLLARRRDVAGARAAYEVAVPLVVERIAKRVGVDPTDRCLASCATNAIRFRTAVAQRAWAVRLTRSIRAVVRHVRSRATSTLGPRGSSSG